MDMSFRHRAEFYFQRVHLESFWHRVNVLNAVQERNLVSPVIGAGYHAHASVAFIDIVERDPGGNLARFRREDRPVGRVLMPHVNAADFGRFILHLVVPYAHFGCCCQLSDFLDNARVVNKPLVGRACLPDVDNLPDRTFCLPAEVGDADRLWDIRFLVVFNYARQFCA